MHPGIERSEPGRCPLCGMALERRMPSGAEDDEEDVELRDLSRRLAFAAVLTVPLLAIVMGSR